jgi:hypothetical protein
MRPDLEHWLGVHYKARVLRSGDPEVVKRLIRQRLEADQGLHQAAVEELARIDALEAFCGGNSQLRQRDYVSWVHREALSTVLTP